MRGVCVVVGLLVALGACDSSSTAPASNDFAIAVTSTNSNVFLGASEQMRATASDGRTLAGTWGSDNPAAITVNATTGLATAVSAGQSNIFFVADGRQGTMLIRAMPDFAGTFSGNYVVTSCAASGDMAAANVCASAPQGTLVPYTFIFSQTGPVLSGRVLVLGADAVPAFAATIGVGGDVGVIGTVLAPGGFKVDTTLQISQRMAAVITGSIAQVWTVPNMSGQANVAGSISTISKIATVGE